MSDIEQKSGEAIDQPHPHNSRRKFLRSSALLTGASLAGMTFDALGATGAGWEPPPEAWRELKRKLEGQLLRPWQAGFANLALPNNLRYQARTPHAIALCANARDVAACLRWASRYDVPLATRGGGHSYAGYSSTEGLMISLGRISTIAYDASARTVTVGGGTRNGSIYAALKSVGRGITHGRCPTVGAGGFLLGGGIGFDMRAHGIACDRLLETEIVLASGEIVVANANQNADLFWACRGGAGGIFGVNTSFTVETFPVDRSVEFQISWDEVSDEFLSTLFVALESAPQSLGSRVSLRPGLPMPGRPAPINVEMIGQYIGSVEELESILAPATAYAAPSSSTIEEMAYWSASTFLAEAGAPGYYQERSRFINGPMSPEIIGTIREWLPRWPNAAGAGSIKFFQTGGATRSPSATETAFVHRSSEWLSSIEIDWTPGQGDESIYRAHRWQNAFYEAVGPLCGGGAYQNFPDPTLQDWAEAYYGENLPRLQQVKQAVDPGQLFRYRQSIRP